MSATAPTTAIPVVILHRDEAPFLRQMVDSIRRHTFTPFRLFVVDNQSTLPESTALLDELESDGAVVIRNRQNRWVLGFNAVLNHPKFDRNAPYFVFSDGDVLVPEPDGTGKCWLNRLVGLMDETACAGKIGLALDLSPIIDRPELRHVVRDEQYYAAGPRIGKLVVAPVDTTLAIYRPNTFIMDEFRFLPGHKSLMRPYLYSLRTTADFSAIHLGWQDYGNPAKRVHEKIRCFARFGGQIDQVTLAMSGLRDRLYYRIAGPIWRALWGSAVAYHWLRYIAKRFPRDLNELQARARTPVRTKKP